jgi:hypothetical protein
VLAWSAAGCASWRGTADEARFRRTCVAVLHESDASAQTKLEEEILARTRLVVRVRAIGRDDLLDRVESPLYADDVTLLAWEALDQGHPCCTTKTTVAVMNGAQSWQSLNGDGLYTHAGLTPPIQPELNPKYSYTGLAADLFLALITVGNADTKLRGTESWSPVVRSGSAGNATAEQHRAIARLRTAQKKEVVDEAWVGQARNHADLLAPPRDAGGELALVVRVKFGLSEDQTEEPCPLTVERRFPLPPGASAGERLTALMRTRGGEIVIGARP